MKKLIFLLFLIILGLNQAIASMMFEGIVKPAHEVKLALPIDGVIAKVFVKEGDGVKKGEKLLKLDDTLQKLEVERRKEIYFDRSELESNKNNLEIIKSLLDSSQELYERTTSVSHDEVKSLRMQYYSLKGKVDTYEARKKQELLDYEISKEVLARHILTSPIDGTVTVVNPEEGEWAKGGEMLVTVVDTSVCYAEFYLEERYARILKKGESVSLNVREGEVMSAKKGKIVFISPVADQASGLVEVKVEFENKSGSVIPGVLANINLQ